MSTDWREALPARRHLSAGEVPSVVWPTDNELGIPLLDPAMQADSVPAPILTWGSVKRTTPNVGGSWLFYTEDYRYTSLWSDPKPIVNSGCAVAAEPNFSCYEDMPSAVAHWRIYQKRWLARWWQTQGIRILVDLNVAPRYAQVNLFGVPSGWKAYATRGYVSRLPQMEAEYEMACNQAQTSQILFVIYGGSRKLRKYCEMRNWHWIPESMDLRKQAKHHLGVLFG